MLTHVSLSAAESGSFLHLVSFVSAISPRTSVSHIWIRNCSLKGVFAAESNHPISVTSRDKANTVHKISWDLKYMRFTPTKMTIQCERVRYEHRWSQEIPTESWLFVSRSLEIDDKVITAPESQCNPGKTEYCIVTWTLWPEGIDSRVYKHDRSKIDDVIISSSYLDVPKTLLKWLNMAFLPLYFRKLVQVNVFRGTPGKVGVSVFPCSMCH